MCDSNLLIVNAFGLELAPKQVHRHLIHLKLLNHSNNKEYVLTTHSYRGRGSRATKQSDNFTLVDYIIKLHVEQKKASGVENYETPVYAYDGAQTLFALEPISVSTVLGMDNSLEIELSDPLKDSLKFLKGSIELYCQPDVDKPTFNQLDVNEWQDPRFITYLEIITSQSAIRTGKYLSHSSGLYINTKKQRSQGSWAVSAKGVHKSCRIVGDNTPKPILELDPQETQYYANIMLDELVVKAITVLTKPIAHLDEGLTRKVKLLIKGLRCNPYYFHISAWSTKIVVIRDIDFKAPSTEAYQRQYPHLKHPHLPAAVSGTGDLKRLYPLEWLRVLPYQTIDRHVLEEFKMIPRARDPIGRWTDMQLHFEELGFNDKIMTSFGVSVCNDPYEYLSEVNSNRVQPPEITFQRKVLVDDKKRDWRSGMVFATPCSIDRLMIIVLADEKYMLDTKKNVDIFFKCFMDACKEKRMVIKDVQFRYCRETTSERFLKNSFRELVDINERNKKNLPFVLLISDERPNIHEYLKYEERMSDIPTQHIMMKTVKRICGNLERNNNNSYRQNRPARPMIDLTMLNIIMKVNVKAGGCNYISNPPRQISDWTQIPTMVIGLDVAHPDKRAARDGFPSVVGMSCNSADIPYSFIGDFSYTTPRKEVIGDEILRLFTHSSVKKFAIMRGFPKKIIVFRDGVSFGEEMLALREAEIIEETVIDAAREAGISNYKPSVMSIVVKKRHHTRFYMRDDVNQPSNPLPDTAVSGPISEYGKRQIFIQAYRPIQGTAKIPSFLILRDDCGISDKNLSELICAVCSLHQYSNSPTSIPTPVYVAHELAKRGTMILKAHRIKEHIERFSIEELNDITKKLCYKNLPRLSNLRVV